jgi:hypothetical protein
VAVRYTSQRKMEQERKTSMFRRSSADKQTERIRDLGFRIWDLRG